MLEKSLLYTAASMRNYDLYSFEGQDSAGPERGEDGAEAGTRTGEMEMRQ